LQHISFSENDAAILAAFDAFLPLGGIDTGEVTVKVSSRNEHIIGSTVSNLTSSGPDELNPKDTLRERCYVSCEAKSSHSCSCVSSETDSSRHKKVSDVHHCCVQNSSDSPDCAANKQHVAHLEVELSHNNHVNPVAEAEAAKARSSAVSIQQKSAGRLSAKIKQTLQQNAKVDTPTRLNRLSAVIEKHDTRSADPSDIGPFYGLPLKVKQLLETQRSITEFYRRFRSLFSFTERLMFVSSRDCLVSGWSLS